MPSLHKTLALSILATLAITACDESQSIKSGNTSSETDSYVIEVDVNDTKSGDIDIAQLQDRMFTTKTDSGEIKALKISDIIASASHISDSELDAYLAKYTCDYQSADGFKASDKGERCKPVSCTLAALSYLNTDSHNIFYDEKSGITNGCYSVRDVAKILLKDADAREIFVYLDNEPLHGISLADLATVNVDGKKAVTLESLLKAAKSDIDLNQYRCDFRSGPAGEKLVSEKDPDCTARSCADIKDQYIVLDTLAIDDGKAENACYEISDVQGIYLSSIVEHYESHIVTVILNGKEAGKVDLASLSDLAASNQGTATVTVAQILEAAGITTDLSTAVCDAASLNNASEKDNYKPVESGKDSCASQLSCSEVAQMTVSLAGSHDLIASGFDNCYNVKGFNTIEITTDTRDMPEKQYDSYEIEVILDGSSVGKIDVATMTDKVQVYEDQDVVYLSDIVQSLLADIDFDKTWCDYVATDGFRPADAKSGECKEIRTCAFSKQAYYPLKDNEKNKTIDINGPSCYGTKFIKSIEVYSDNPNP